MRRKLLTILALTGAMAGAWAGPMAAPARAQGAFDMGALGQTLSIGIRIPEEPGAAPPQAAPAPPAADLRFNADPARRQAVIARLVSAARQGNPAAGEEIERFFTTQDVFGVIRQWMARYDLRMDDVGDVVAVRLVGAWLASRGSDDDPTPAQMAGVRRQVQQAGAATPLLASAGEAQRQEIADTLLAQSALLSAAVTGAKGNPAQLRQIQQMAAAGIRNDMQIDLTAVELTDQGLRPRR
jgi:hypothetical protein